MPAAHAAPAQYAFTAALAAEAASVLCLASPHTPFQRPVHTQIALLCECASHARAAIHPQSAHTPPSCQACFSYFVVSLFPHCLLPRLLQNEYMMRRRDEVTEDGTHRTPLSRPANVLGMFHLFAPNRKARWASGCFWRSLWIGIPGGSGSYSHSSSQMSRIASNPRPNSRAHGVSYNCSAPVVLQPAPASSFNEALYTAGQCVGGEEYAVLDESAVSAHFVKHVSRLIVAANKDGSVPASPLFRHVAAVVEQSAEDEHTRGPFEKITARYEQLSPVLAGDMPPHHLHDPVADPAAPAETHLRAVLCDEQRGVQSPGLRRLSGLRRIRVV